MWKKIIEPWIMRLIFTYYNLRYNGKQHRGVKIIGIGKNLFCLHKYFISKNLKVSYLSSSS